MAKLKSVGRCRQGVGGVRNGPQLVDIIDEQPLKELNLNLYLTPSKPLSVHLLLLVWDLLSPVLTVEPTESDVVQMIVQIQFVHCSEFYHTGNRKYSAPPPK